MYNGTLNPLELIGKPCAVNPNPPYSFNCWGLVEYIRKMCFDLETPLIISYEETLDPEGPIKKLFESGNLSKWRVILSNYNVGDVVLLATNDKNNFNHVGVFVKTNFIMHATSNTVICNSMPVVKRVYKNLRVYRWPLDIS